MSKENSKLIMGVVAGEIAANASNAYLLPMVQPYVPAVAGISSKTLVNGGLGTALIALGLSKNIGTTAKLASVVCGGRLIADELWTLMQGVVAPSARMSMSRPMVRQIRPQIRATVQPAMTSYPSGTTSDGGLVYVD